MEKPTKRPTWILALAAVAAIGFTSTTVSAQSQRCDQRQKVLGHLSKKHQEVPVAAGVTSSGGLVEVLTNDDGNTWTIIVSQPNGTACLIAAGEGWRKFEFDETVLDPQV